ncbi:MAG: CoA transferase [Dehalococcoidia bacterium]|nr:CoA transferase [Dehalococcoidia bacterium]
MSESPLNGIRVVEVANWLAAPAAGALLADMGAEVIKIEPPSGEPWRHFQMESMGYDGPFPINYCFEVDNRGKRSVALDIGIPTGREAALRLIDSCDVFLTNLVPARRERFGLSYPQLSQRNPRLVYLGFSGYGPEGPDRDRLGFDYTAFWARSGIMSVVGEPGETPALLRGGMGDHTTAPLLALGVMAALFERERSGLGQEVTGSLLNTGLWVLSSDVQAALVTQQAPRRIKRTDSPNPIWNSYRAGDGNWFLLVMPTPDPYWPKVCAAIGRPDLGLDPAYATLALRRERSPEIIALFEQVFVSMPLAEWGRRFDAAGIIWAPVQTLDEVITDPQVRANGYFTTVDHPTHGPYETLQTPLKFSRSDVRARGAAPEVGQHTEEVLLEAGFTWDEITGLRESGALG